MTSPVPAKDLSDQPLEPPKLPDRPEFEHPAKAVKKHIIIYASVLLTLLIMLAGLSAFGYRYYHDKHLSTSAATISSQNTDSTKSPVTPAQPVDVYAGWQTYSNSQVSFKYPSGWIASNGRGQSAVADATSTAFESSATTTAENPGAQVTLYLQVSTDNLTIDCASAPCQVTAVVPLSNPQLPGAVLAIVNQTSGNGTNFTEYVVASSGTKVGDTSVSPVKTGSKNAYIFGQPYYTPSNGGLTIAARVTNASVFQSDSHFKDLLGLINNVMFN